MRSASRFTVLALLAVLSIGARAEDIFGLTSDGKLVRFDSATPGIIKSTVTISGLVGDDALVGIDFRPATGQLYGLGKNSRVYIIDVATGAATALGTANFSTPALSGASFGFDFNPQADRIRVVSDTGQNIRLNPLNGTNAATDLAFAYAAGDASVGLTPKLVGSAYSNNFPGSNVTTLYAIDQAQATLITQGSLNSVVSPNGSGAPVNATQLFTVGKLGVTPTTQVGFDISGASAIAYASIVLQGETASKLFTVNLSTGTASLVGAVGSSVTLIDLSVLPPPFPYDMVALTNGNAILRFNTSNPAITSMSSLAGGNAISLRGLMGTDSIVGIDYRPANGLLYGVGVDNAGAGTTARLYTINPVTGQTALVNATSTFTVGATEYGIDFNPAADRLRITTDTGLNLRVNPDTGALVLADTPLAFNGTDVNAAVAVRVVASAYFNNSAGVTTTTLYDIQVGNVANNNNGVLVSQVPPNNGTLNTVGDLGITPGTSNVGFDITSNGNFLMAANILYRVNLSTGVATQIGANAINNNQTTIRDIAAVIPQAAASAAGTVQFSAATYTVIEGSTATVTVTRTGNTSGTVAIDYVASAGTATAGTDFTAVSGTLVLADGEASQTFTVAALTDSVQELFETVTLTLSNPVGCVVGTQATATLSIADFNDHDGDGFSTAEELAAGTSDENASDTPFGGGPAGTVDTTSMTVSKATVKLNFLKANSDSVSFSGVIAGLSTTTTDKNFVATFGGFSKSVKLTAKGSGVTADKTYSAKVMKGGKFSVKISKTAIAASLADEGLGDDPDSPSKAPRTAIVKVLFDGKAYQVTVNLVVTIKAGKSSSASLAKNK